MTDVSRFDARDLGEAIVQGNALRVARIVDALRAEGEALPLILWNVAFEIRALLAVGGALRAGRPMGADLQREYRLWGPRQAQVERAARNRDARLLLQALREAAMVDRMVKGIAAGDAWQALLALALRACGKPAVPVVTGLA